MERPSLSITRRPVVLLVQPPRDDSLEMYAEFLRYHGLAVIPVSDARDALRLAPQADIVVTGMNLDNPMDGVELVSRLRHDDCTRSTPIVVLTACAWPTDRERAEAAGCDAFLPKPCLPNECWAKCGNCSLPHRRPTERTSFNILRTARRVIRADGIPLSGCLASVKVIVMATSTNGKRRSTVRRAPDHSSFRSVALERSANVTEYDIACRAY